MRFLSSLFLGLVAAVLVIALAVFALQNIGALPVQFLGYNTTGNVWWVTLAAAALGFVVALLLMAPGRVAASWRIQGLSRQMQRQDEELATIHQQQTDVNAEHEQVQQLQAERDQLAAERDRLLAERHQPAQPVQQPVVQQPARQPVNQPVDQPVMAQPQPAAAVIPGMAAAPYVAVPAPEQSDTPREREDVVFSPGSYPKPTEAAAARDDTADGEQPSLADRVRGFFRGPSEDTAPTASSDGDDTTLPDGAYPREDRPVSPRG